GARVVGPTVAVVVDVIAAPLVGVGVDVRGVIGAIVGEKETVAVEVVKIVAAAVLVDPVVRDVGRSRVCGRVAVVAVGRGVVAVAVLVDGKRCGVVARRVVAISV